MPHGTRRKGESGFYHVVTKGDGGQVIFEDDADRLRYLETLVAAQEEYPTELHAYCLMGNHVHLLIRDPQEVLSAFMKKLDETYAMYFAKKTGRVGSVFQSRFWSEPVDTDERFLATIRYIHANPEPAGIASHDAYPWSSYPAYVGGRYTGPAVKTDMALGLLGGVEPFREFSVTGKAHVRPFKGSSLHHHLTTDETIFVALEVLDRETINGLKGMDAAMRLPHLLALSHAGFTDSEIARITGIGQVSIHRALH